MMVLLLAHIRYESSITSIIIITSMQAIILVKNNPKCTRMSQEVSFSERMVSTLSCNLLDSTKHFYRMLSEDLTLDFDLYMEADEVADVEADCNSGRQLWEWHISDGMQSSWMARAKPRVSSSLSSPEDNLPEVEGPATVENFSVNPPSFLPLCLLMWIFNQPNLGISPHPFRSAPGHLTQWAVWTASQNELSWIYTSSSDTLHQH